MSIISSRLPRFEKAAAKGTPLFLFIFATGLCLLLFRRYFAGPFQYVFLDMSSDTLRINLPTYYLLCDTLVGGFSGWSMQMGIGTNLLSHADVLFDPFTYFAFLGGRAHIADLLILPVMLKIVCASLTAYGYLRCFTLRRAACAVAGVAYAFSGYMLVMGRNYVFSTICVYLPLILWGLERFLQNKRWGLLLGSLFLTAIYFYYFFYMTAIIAALYVILRFPALHTFTAKGILRILLHLFCVGIAALLLASFVVLPTVLLTLQSSRLSSTGITHDLLTPNFRAFFTALARMFGADSAGVFEIWNYAGYQSDYFELATFTSALCMLTFPQYVCTCSKRSRRTIAVIAFTVAAALLFPAFSYALNGFSALTYRWSFILNLLLALGCALGLHTILTRRSLVRRVLLCSVAVCGLALLLSQIVLLFGESALPSSESLGIKARFAQTYLQHPSALVGYGILVAYFLALLPSRVHRFSPLLLSVCLLSILSGEMFVNYYHWLHSSVAVTRNETRLESTFFDDSLHVIDALQAQDPSFFRIAKNYDSVRDVESGLISNNDAMAQDFYGLQSYNSQNQPNYISFLQRMGIFVTMPLHTPAPEERPEDMTGTSLNFINGVGTRYKLAAYLGAKYYLVKEPCQPTISPENAFYYFNAFTQPIFTAPAYFTPVGEQSGIRCYRNEAYFPFAFSRSRFVRESEFALLTNEQKDAVLTCFGVIEDALASDASLPITPIQSALSTASATSFVEIAAAHRAQMQTFLLSTDANLTVSLTIPTQESIVTFTTPFEDGWHITVDGVPTKALRTDCGMLGVAADVGTHTFRLTFVPQGLWLGCFLSLVTALSLCAALLFARKRRCTA